MNLDHEIARLLAETQAVLEMLNLGEVQNTAEKKRVNSFFGSILQLAVQAGKADQKIWKWIPRRNWVLIIGFFAIGYCVAMVQKAAG